VFFIRRGVARIRLSAATGQGINLPEQESNVRVDGTVVDAAGLIVVSLLPCCPG